MDVCVCVLLCVNWTSRVRDVRVKVSAMHWCVPGSHGDHLHVVQRSAAASRLEDPLPVGGSRDQRGHLGHGSVGFWFLGMMMCVCCMSRVLVPPSQIPAVLDDADVCFQVLLGARSFVQSSRTRGCCAFRSQMFCQVLYSLLGLLASCTCSLVSATGLSQGPLCLYNSSSGLTWGVPLQPQPDRHSGYLYNQSLWSGVCVEPCSVVQWNLVLFGVMGATSALQAVICGFSVLNSLLGLILGQGFCHNKVRPVSV
ncbi:transcript variant X1 [Nothobranchius furzeri]|uniref:Transcript variant X1 n=1 Tax=Nothobranchius furzeri TaxID=105023 RepID=A0A9D2Y029_NOTFU|nr:transcript variant X1 [Nothobranchius furzeri]